MALRRKRARTAKDPELDKATFNAFCEEDKSVLMFLKTVTIKGSMYLSDSAWGAIKPDTIKNCWTKALGGPNTEYNAEEDEHEDFLGFRSAGGRREVDDSCPLKCTRTRNPGSIVHRR